MSYETKLRECGVKKLEIAIDLNEKFPFSVRECIAWHGEKDINVTFVFSRFISLEKFLIKRITPAHYPLFWASQVPAASEKPEGGKVD